MNHRRLTRLACALALACSFSASAAPLFDRVQGALSGDASRTATVELSQTTLRAATAGSEITVAIPNVGTYQYRVVRRVEDADVVRIEGALQGNGEHRITLGLRGSHVSGLIATPDGTFSLGYVNDRQWLAAVGKQVDWPELGDSGRPLVFQDRVPNRKETAPVKGAQPIDINLAQLTSMAEGDEATLPLSDVGPVRVTYDNTRANADSTTWVGYLSDYGKDFRVLLTYSPAGTVGQVLTPQGEYEILTSANGDTYLIDPRKLGMKRVEGDDSCEVAAPLAGAAGGHVSGNATATTATAPQTVTTAGALPNSVVIDVLVLYTAGFATDKGGTAGAQTAIDHMISLSNQAYVDSGVPIVLRKVAADQVNVSDKTNNSTVLNDLTNGAGAFSGVKARRDAVGADLVTIVRPFWNQYQVSCGVGWIGGYNQSSISGYANYAYSVVSDGRDRANTGWYCDPTAFPHELGHNMGLMHDRATVTSQGGGKGATAYAYGYGTSGSFGTVMSYIWPKVGKFSNPRDFTCGGNNRCGVPDTDTTRSADNAKALAYTSAGVAGFRAVKTTSTTSTTTLTVTGTVTVNGKVLSGVQFKGASCSISGTNGTYRCTMKPGFTGTITPSYVVSGKATRFTPASRSYSNLRDNAVNQNFSGVR